MIYLRQSIKIFVLIFTVPFLLLVLKYAPNGFNGEFVLMVSFISCVAFLACIFMPIIFSKQINTKKPVSRISFNWNKNKTNGVGNNGDEGKSQHSTFGGGASGNK